MPTSAGLPRLSERALKWHVYRSRKHSDTRPEFLMEIARCVSRLPAESPCAPLLEIGTRSGGSAMLMLRILEARYGKRKPPTVVTVDPYGARPYEGADWVYDDRHYGKMKRNLAGFTNHIHYMMDSELFLKELDRLYVWSDGARYPLDRFSLVYLDGSHDPAIVWAEIEALLPRIVPGGFLIVDDTEWFDFAVRKRIDAAASKWGVTLRHSEKQSIIGVPASLRMEKGEDPWRPAFLVREATGPVGFGDWQLSPDEG
jgi:predicted O-methyltransferase YrrM